MAKADTACSSARALLQLGDVDGATNRAYYAMFDAARAALLASGAPVEPDIGRTHSGLIAAFGNYLVKNGPVSKDVGRLLNRAHEIRLVADYNGTSVELADAKQSWSRPSFLSPPCVPSSCRANLATTLESAGTRVLDPGAIGQVAFGKAVLTPMKRAAAA